MPSYRACLACACYVRRGDLACPFCAAALPPEDRQPAPPRRARGSRAMWLACGAAFATVGCTESHGAPGSSAVDATFRDEVPTQGEAAEASAEMAPDTAVDTRAETPIDAAVDTWVDGTFGPDVAANEASDADGATEGGFTCIPAGIQGDAAIMCDPKTQYCDLHAGNLTAPSHCAALDPKCLAYPPIADASSCPYLASSSCDGGLRCSCIAVEAYSAFTGSCWSCSDDAGGLALSCGACYGAPPADLRRQSARSSEARERTRDTA